MAVKEGNGAKGIHRTDLWRSNNTCVICQDHCPSREDKNKHENQSKHKKKLLVYEFFAKEVPKFGPFSGSSILVKRYTSCGEQAIGLECLHELHFSFNSQPWWACSICYESGALMEQADIHLTSMSHITTYLDEFHPSKTSSLQMDGDRLKVFEDIKQLCNGIFEEQGGEMLPPECLVMDSNLNEKDAMAKLGVDADRLKPSYRLHTDCTDEAHPRKILQCLICRQCDAVNDDLLKRIWSSHELSPVHRQAVIVNQFLEQFNVEYILDADVPGSEPKAPFTWKIMDGCNYGPLCGAKFLVSFNERSFCQLCCCEVQSIERHFSSESHIIQFLTISHPVEMFRVSQYAREARMKKVLEMLSNPKFCFDNEQSRKVQADWFPKNLEVILKPEAHEFPAFMPELTSLGIDSKCLFCNVCVKAIRVGKDVEDKGEAVWNSHCAEQSHFNFAVRRACFGFHYNFFVPMSSNIPKAPWNLHGKWTEITEGEKRIHVQTQGDVGLEYVVDDQENQEVVCTLCACWFPRGMDQDINNHIRSYQHLNHYLHATNRNLLSMVMVQKTEEASRELALEWLKRSIHHDMDEMRVYSPEMSLQMTRWGMIPVRKIEMSNYDSAHRPVVECLMNLLDIVAADGAEKIEVPIKEALSAGGIKVHALKYRNGNIERILCRCTHCELAFSTTVGDIISNIWDRHLTSDQHFARIRAFLATKLDMLGFSESTSSYTVKPFKQQDPSRKVTWQWNAKDKTHEFVLNVIGLEDLVERRSSESSGPHPPDFFCRLCAVVIARRSAALEAHIRSAQHVLCYVHKYHPLTIMELDSLPKEGGKEMRKMLAQLLKDHELKEPYCIPIYDPIGEQERKGIVAMQKAKEEERQRVLSEARLKAQEQRKKRDEERRKQREIEMEQEEIRQAERARKEKEARERAKRLEEEKAHVKKLLLGAARKVEEERKAKETRELTKDETERQKRQEHLRSLLDREKARLRALHEKEAAQRRLLAEKEELEKKMREIQERTGVHNQPQRPVQNHPHHSQPPPPRNGPSSHTSIGESQPLDSNMRPPPHHNGGFKTQQELTRQPLLGHAPMMQSTQHGPVPPPSQPFGKTPPPMRESYENLGPKLLFSKFVPVPEQAPVFKGLEEAGKATRSRPKSPSAEKKRGIRPSLLERKVDPYISNAKIIQSRDQLVDFIWRQGAERIPSDELPIQFNEKAAMIEGALGVDCIYEVVCADCSDLDTFYCSMCGVWTTPSEMFKHLETVGHKLAYLFRNHKMYHQTVVSETNSLVREAMLSQFAIQIWKMEQPPGQVCNRLRSLLDRATIERVWPEHVKVLDHSWKEEGKTVGRVEVPPPLSKEAWSFIDSDSIITDKRGKEKNLEEIKIKKELDEWREIHSRRKDEKNKKERARDERCYTPRRVYSSGNQSRKRSLPEKSSSSKQRDSSKITDSPDYKRRRSCSRSHERRGREKRRSHDRSSSRSRHDRHRSSSREHGKRSRSRSRSRLRSLRQSSRRRSRSRSRSCVLDSGQDGKGMSWEETAAAFLAKLGDVKAAAKVLDLPKEKDWDRSSTSASSWSFVDEKIKQLRNLAIQTPPTSSKEKCALLSLNEEAESSFLESDEKAQMRKLLGVLITMQQEAERSGNLDESIVDKLYREVGLKRSVKSSSDQLLAQICSEITQGTHSANKPSIDLQSFGISAKPQLTQMQQPSIFAGGSQTQPLPPPNQPSAIQLLLSEVKRSLGNLKSAHPSSPFVRSPPFVINSADDVFPESHTISCVFPGADSKEIIQVSSTNTPQSEEHLTKKERAALRRKMLLEEAERLRKQAEEDDFEDDDDDWDSLAEIINRPVPTNDSNPPGRSMITYESSMNQSESWFQDRKINDRDRSYDRVSDDMGKSYDRKSGDRGKGSSDWKSYEKGKEQDSKFSSNSKKLNNFEEDKPIDPRQKIPLQRTILPDLNPAKESKEEKFSKKEKKKKESKELSKAGKPIHWPQPIPQPLLGLCLDPPSKELRHMGQSEGLRTPHEIQPSSQEMRQLAPSQFAMPSESAYLPIGSAPVYIDQYQPLYSIQQPQFQNPQFYSGQQQFMGQGPPMQGGFGGPPPVQQQYYGQPSDY